MTDPKFALEQWVEVFSRTTNRSLGWGRVKDIQPTLEGVFTYRVSGHMGYFPEFLCRQDKVVDPTSWGTLL